MMIAATMPRMRTNPPTLPPMIHHVVELKESDDDGDGAGSYDADDGGGDSYEDGEGSYDGAGADDGGGDSYEDGAGDDGEGDDDVSTIPASFRIQSLF